jgi:PadR family transcriptional regulator, regulatory protein PadR
VAIVDHKAVTREVLLGFWKVHILHHAAEEPVVGQWILAELRRHGHDVSPGTLYPMLKRMERNGWLRCETDPAAGLRGRRYYHLTARGAAVLKVLREAVVELHHEVVEEAAEHARAKSVTATTRRSGPASVKPRRGVSPRKARRS